MKKTKIVLPNGTNINFETDEPLSIKKNRRRNKSILF